MKTSPKNNVSVPAGWKLVPVEPTESMREAWNGVFRGSKFSYAFYAAMLRAAPSPIYDPHSDDLAVDRFATAMKAKLAQKRADGFGGWDDPDQCHIDYLAHLLAEQIHSRAVLDPVDIGNFAMMIFNRGETPSHGR